MKRSKTIFKMSLIRLRDGESIKNIRGSKKKK